jgi:hypothetical protein
MPENVLDLDILKPDPRIVKLRGVEIDISFIPVGITFEVDEIVKQMVGLDQEALTEGRGDVKGAIDMAIRLCSMFCTVKNPELSEEWFREYVTAGQLMSLAEAIKDTLQESYKGVEEYSSQSQ